MDIEERDRNIKNTIKSNLVSFGIEAKIIEQITEHLYQDLLGILGTEKEEKND